MDPALIGLLITVVTIGVFALGIPVAFGLGFVAVTFLLLFEGFGMSKVIADTFMEGFNGIYYCLYPNVYCNGNDSCIFTSW